ncbi:MAG: anti-sigma factor [Flavobacteriaceae bacterium]|nr:anti-sigma factor [Bacteroidia bacterium]NND10967.1 anti-sigma factor [Flavobacteriaceae bacterium]NNL59813.1 anti-sigma factor [Flavobacteriaceae bacterium]RZV59969.1 MAG: anti-sigma factor [Flavobacteriaceae bacterium]RZW42912.1 MAG: anti-sigma factor [Flavobacteriaceae bacterium]
MKREVQLFLGSGLLERYLVGDTNDSENYKVEAFISEYPEVKAEYNLLQDNLEILAKSNAVEPPRNILNDILKELDETPVIALSQVRKPIPWFGIAASVAAVLFGALSLFLYTQNQSLIDENNMVNDELNELLIDAAHTQSELADITKKYDMLNNPETNKYILRGNKRAKNLKTVAYINTVDKLSMIDVVDLPQLPDDQIYQLWAEVNDKMVNLGILDESNRNLIPVPYLEDALSYNITIEPKGGNQTASVENSVANISLQNNNK